MPQCLLGYTPSGQTPPWADIPGKTPRWADTPRANTPGADTQRADTRPGQTPSPPAVTAADGAHPTVMHSCSYCTETDSTGTLQNFIGLGLGIGISLGHCQCEHTLRGMFHTE